MQALTGLSLSRTQVFISDEQTKENDEGNIRIGNFGIKDLTE
jgi:hypothetical protein